jgi:hypothetical protein
VVEFAVTFVEYVSCFDAWEEETVGVASDWALETFDSYCFSVDSEV